MPRPFLGVMGLVLVCLMPVWASPPFELTADTIHVLPNTTAIAASGNVTIMYDPYTVTGNVMRYDRNNDALYMSEGVTITDTMKNELTADRMDITIGDQRGHIMDGVIRTRQGIILSARRIDLERDYVQFSDCTITACLSKKPVWYIASQTIHIDRNTNMIRANNNAVYVYGFPIFFIPNFAQNVLDDTINNRPAPELGYSPIDHAYGNVYLGYSLTNTVAGTLGVGVSQLRGFRYGASHVWSGKRTSVIINTYQVEKTGFEGGVRFKYIKKNVPADPFFLIGQPENALKKETAHTFSMDYTWSNVIYNELYDMLPEVGYRVDDIPLVGTYTANGAVGMGYYVDRIHQGQRYYGDVVFRGLAYRFSDTFRLDYAHFVHGRAYDDAFWHRMIGEAIFTWDNNRYPTSIRFAKMMYQSGMSPFIFDTINAVTQDELGLKTAVRLGQFRFGITMDYQLNSQSFRSRTYSLDRYFDCWVFSTGYNAIWNTVYFNVSLPTLDGIL